MNDIILHAQINLSFLKEIVKHLPWAIKKRLPKEITLIAVSLKESLKLNRRYLNKRKPANVLSFLYSSAYGEIILCPVIIKKDAKKQGSTEVFQMTLMVLHGMLHLAGLHHEKSKTIAKMSERIEQEVLCAIMNEKLKIKK